MNEYLTIEEEKEITGGGKLSSFALALIVSGVVSFIIGAVNGYQRPYPCNYTGK